MGSESSPEDFLRLLKPRVSSLVIFTSVVGLLLAPGTIHPVIGFIAILCVALGAGAAGALNMWYDADIDAMMTRTRARPIPSGRVAPEDALVFGMLLAMLSVAVLGLTANWISAGFLAFTIFFYVCVYTMWLKRRTPQNIVIGGAAGAFPPMIGWTIVTGELSFDSFLLFLMIFFWTPPHFWALALVKSEDYERAGVPMLPVLAGDRVTRAHILGYAVILAPITLLPFFFGMVSYIYLFAVVVSNGLFIHSAFALYRVEGEAARVSACWKTFRLSIYYLGIVFGALLLDRAASLALFE